MIVMFLSGGVGNQIFQYLWAKEIERKYSIHVEFCNFFYAKNIDGIDKREVWLHKIKNLDINWYKTDKLSKFYGINNRWKKKLYYIINIFCFFAPNSFFILSERYIFLLPFISYFFSDVVVYGLGKQSYSREFATSFLHNFECICDDTERSIKPIIDECFIGVLVRRGDYIKLKLALDVNYYVSNIVEELHCQAGDVYVFSDDINWCQNNINIDGRKFVYNVDYDSCPVCKLGFISRFKRLIVSDSTFDFFAWQIGSDYLDKTIRYPKGAKLFEKYSEK